MISAYAIVTGVLLLVLCLGARTLRPVLRDKQRMPLHS